MADDSLPDPSALPRTLPVPATTLATLEAAILAPAELAGALRFAAAAKAANTNRAYAADWVDFCRWAAARGVSPCPARPACCAAISRPSPTPAAARRPSPAALPPSPSPPRRRV
jgi:hypothetical protein